MGRRGESFGFGCDRGVGLVAASGRGDGLYLWSRLWAGSNGLSLGGCRLGLSTRVSKRCRKASAQFQSVRGTDGQIVKEVKARARNFNFVEFVHENRSSNVDAHNLARSLISFVPGRHVWLLTPPEGVCNLYDQLY